MSTISVAGPATAVSVAIANPCFVLSNAAHAPRPQRNKIASAARLGRSGNGIGGVVVVSTPDAAYCVAKTEIAAKTTGHDGSNDVLGAPGQRRANARFSSANAASPSGPFYTSERRGGVERRQLALKGVKDGD
jgi:hypothetical protein